MKLEHINILYIISSMLVVASILIAILSETGLIEIGDHNLMQLVGLLSVLWFLVWQLRRNERMK